MTAIPAATSFAFPHATLTKIQGRPTEQTVKLLQRELYANARAVPSTRGGGTNGYLGLLMPATKYSARAGVRFPWYNVSHPGNLPVHEDDATSASITALDRKYDAQLREYNELTKVKQALKTQLLEAIEPTYLRILSDEEFGFADVSPAFILEHLRTNYSDIEPEELELNRMSLKATYNVDEPMELLWEKVQTARNFAERHGDPISEFNALNLTLASIEATGVFTDACDKWRDLPSFGKTFDSFRTFFEKENRTRLRKLTARQGGFHGANAATNNAANNPPANGAITVDDTKMYYCWTHGLGWNPQHTSALCSRKGEGHQDTATARNLQGGCNTIMVPRRRPDG